MFILSNTNETHWNYFLKKKESKKIIELFDSILLSYKIGMRKPNRDIYDFLIKKANTSPEKIVNVEVYQNGEDQNKR